jgi:hypothetical protein
MKKLFLLTFGLAFVACAPQPLGSRGNPIQFKPGDVVTAELGGETFFTMTGPIYMVDRGTRDQDFKGTFSDTSQLSPGRSESRIVNWFQVGKTSLPEGVKLELVRQEAKREVGQTTSDTQYIYYYLIDSVSLTFSVKTDAKVAGEFARGSFELQRWNQPKSGIEMPMRLAFVAPKAPDKK